MDRVYLEMIRLFEVSEQFHIHVGQALVFEDTIGIRITRGEGAFASGGLDNGCAIGEL